MEAFEKFAKDHYGELGFSRMNVGANKYYAGGKWIITFGISYSAYVEVGLKIAMALYETGAPVVFHDAGNLLHILEESGKVRLTPFTFHDYLEGGDDEGVFELPYVEDCDRKGELTRAQYDEIVRLAEWEPDVQWELDKVIPLEDIVYDLIRVKAGVMGIGLWLLAYDCCFVCSFLNSSKSRLMIFSASSRNFLIFGVVFIFRCRQFGP